MVKSKVGAEETEAYSRRAVHIGGSGATVVGDAVAKIKSWPRAITMQRGTYVMEC